MRKTRLSATSAALALGAAGLLAVSVPATSAQASTCTPNAFPVCYTVLVNTTIYGESGGRDPVGTAYEGDAWADQGISGGYVIGLDWQSKIRGFVAQTALGSLGACPF